MRRLIFGVVVALAMTASAWAASQHRGQVTFNGSPVPGTTVTATQGDTKVVSVTDAQGLYSFANLADGKWTVRIEMSGFAVLSGEVEVASNASDVKWEMKLLSLDQIRDELRPAVTAAASATPASVEGKPRRSQNLATTGHPATPPSQNQAGTEHPANDVPAAPATPSLTTKAPEEDDGDRAADGLLINGSANNGAASPFSQAAGFGNNRFGNRKLYNGSFGLIVDNSALDARPYSLTGQSASKAAYNRLTGVFTLGGPIRIPHLLQNGGNFFVAYQWTRNNNSTIQSALMPTDAQRNGVFASPIVDPMTGSPFSGNTIPSNRFSPQATALVRLYPRPNVAGNSGYNYQVPIVSPTHQDALQSRYNRTFHRTNQVSGGFAFQSMRSSNPNVFGFLDTTSTLGLDANVNWSRRITNQWFLNAGYQYSRNSLRVVPYYQDRENISGEAGISGNNQDPVNWGPPALVFASGIAALSDAQSSSIHNQTSGVSYSMLWNHGAHSISFGTDFKRRQFNSRSQQDPRGTFTFTGAGTGSDFASLLLGRPDTVSIAYGNADKYFRQSIYDAYAVDDWRLNSSFTLNLGLRWEYEAPITELRNRLVSLDIASGFAAAAPVVASDPVGALTGNNYPNSLVRPDKLGLQPRLGIAWKPVPGSSLVVRAGYGVYYDSSVYQSIAAQMAQQPPLSVALNVQNSAAAPLTLADGFQATPSSTRNTFAIDPNFQVGYAQNWQLSVQRSLPASLQITGSYLGIKGTHGVQAFLPNTYPIGGVNPCPACPAGFVYLASGGNSSRHAGQVQLRRRLHSGIQGSLQYTFSKSIDNMAALGGQAAGAPGGNPLASGRSNLVIAQNWLDLASERGLSSFDQRHLLKFQMQYTSGMGLAGGTFLTGWQGGLFKDWTIATQLSAGSGLPETPIYFAAVPGTGTTGTIRPNYTGAPLYAAGAGRFLNSAAFAAPTPGQWGNARKGSITGPSQFGLNASLARTFRSKDRISVDFRIDATNLLNHVTYTSWVSTINSAQFGLPAATNAMRNVQFTMRLRF